MRCSNTVSTFTSGVFFGIMRASAPMMPLRAKASDENAAGAEIIIVGYSKRDSNGGKNEYSQWQSGQSRDAGAADGADFPDGTDTAGADSTGILQRDAAGDSGCGRDAVHGAEIRRAAGLDLRCNKLCVGAASSIYAGRHADGGVAADGDCDDLPAAFDGAGGDSLRPQGNGA